MIIGPRRNSTMDSNKSMSAGSNKQIAKDVVGEYERSAIWKIISFGVLDACKDKVHEQRCMNGKAQCMVVCIEHIGIQCQLSST